MLNEISRRTFIKNAGLAGAAIAVSDNVLGLGLPAPGGIKNKFPRWRGFNLLDFYTSRPLSQPRRAGNGLTTEDDLKWIADWGFDFIRIPVQYPCYVNFDPGTDRSKHITPEEVLRFNEQAIQEIEKLVYLVNKHNLHVSFNLHRVPGFCVNSGFYEPYNLWKDEAAQQALYAHWKMWAQRFKIYRRRS